MNEVVAVGEELINSGHFGAEHVQQRLDEIKSAWKHLLDLAAYRRKRLEEAVDYHQVGCGACAIQSVYVLPSVGTFIYVLSCFFLVIMK